MDQNPLNKFFRQPSIYIRLPSQGHGWQPESINYPANGEIPVMPMTAIDEITYRTPDALFNGEAVVSVIESCIPCIRNAWHTPSIDLDTILVSIRIASYGHSMDIATRCPKCETDTDFGLDLRTVLDGLKTADYGQKLTIGDLEFGFRPLNYREMTDNSGLQFEQQKTLQMLGDLDGVDEKSKVEQVNSLMKKLIEVTIKALCQSIVYIRTPDTTVSEQAFIEEFLNNCDRTVFNSVRDHVVTLREESELQPLKISCPSCQHQYKQAFTLDMANFFAPAS